MPEARLTSKGQVTIPKEVREALHVHAGDRVQFLIRDDGVVEIRSHTVDLEDLYGILEHQGKAVTVEAMNEAIGSAVAESFKRSVGQ
jgi:AbrB family looped-hinge helix DNA binding protein